MTVAAELMPGTIVRAPGLRVLQAIVAVGVAAACASIVLALKSDHVSEPGVQSGLIDWITLPYILSGVIAWWRRPQSRLGPLMIAAGFVTFVSTLQWTSLDVPFTVGQTLDLVPVALFLHVFLAFPSGRLDGRFDRWLVTTSYAIAIGLELVGMAIGASPITANVARWIGTNCPRNQIADVKSAGIITRPSANESVSNAKERRSGRPPRLLRAARTTIPARLSALSPNS